MRERDLYWAGSSYEDLMDFPADAIQDAGYQLGKVQQDKEPDDWKPIVSVGPGVREIRIFERTGAYRVLYVVKIKGLVHVLHCFHKTTEQTSQRDIDKGRIAYREVEAALAATRVTKKTTKGRQRKE